MKPIRDKTKETPFYYGGQAVMEGVMMRGKTLYAMAVRKPDGEIMVITKNLTDKSKSQPWRKWPVVRGVFAFADALALGMSTLTQSAEIATEGIEEEPSRFELFLQKKFGDKLNKILINLSVVFAVAVAVLLFVLLPLWIGSGFSSLFSGNENLVGIVEGISRICIFIGYVLLISRSKDIRRVFQYHGAEHKTINGYENGAELSVEGIIPYSRLHNRCSTSFILIVMVISVLVFTLLSVPNPWLKIVSRLALIPVIAGISYEIIKWAGHSKSPLVKLVSGPGLLLQRLTTGEPDGAQIETAIAALKSVLESETGTKSELNTELKPESANESVPETVGIQ